MSIETLTSAILREMPDTEQLPCIGENKDHRIYGGIVYVKSLKRLVKTAITVFQ